MSNDPREDFNTVLAEGHYAAKAGDSLLDNPYPSPHMFHTLWKDGFNAELLTMRTELQIMKKSYSRFINERRELLAKIEQLESELEMEMQR